MTFTTSKIFVDSSVLIEAFKGNRVSFYNSLISEIDREFFINEIVLSEYLYYIQAISSGSSPRSLQEKEMIPSVLSSIAIETLLPKDFSLLKSTPFYFDEVPTIMAKYNLLPNDAIILASCKIHRIDKLASHDSDFIIPCREEGIELLREE